MLSPPYPHRFRGGNGPALPGPDKIGWERFLPIRSAMRTAHGIYAARCPLPVGCPHVCTSKLIHPCGRPPGLSRKKSRIRNCCADPARNKLCHTGTARKASVPVIILCRNSITDTGADDRRPCEAVRSDSCTFFLLKCPAKPFRRIETTACGIFLLFLVCHRITPAGGDVNPFLISPTSFPIHTQVLPRSASSGVVPVSTPAKSTPARSAAAASTALSPT